MTFQTRTAKSTFLNSAASEIKNSRLRLTNSQKCKTDRARLLPWEVSDQKSGKSSQNASPQASQQPSQIIDYSA